ncbi:recombinase family protein [Neorhizobium sp. DAR64861/K0K2]|uniref:recombinase family protein n=1 Tax=unclassified Neorhizobium TaxID=2629175 RepID=UPI003D299350
MNSRSFIQIGGDGNTNKTRRKKATVATKRQYLDATTSESAVPEERQVRVAIYSRVSSDDSVDSNLSLPNQEDLGFQHCAKNNWKVVAVYREEGKSAKTDDRRKFLQMINDAMQGTRPFDVIVVHSTSRFARNVEHYLKYKRKLHGEGIELISLTQTFARDTGGFLAEMTTSGFDEYHSRRTSADVTRSMTAMAKAGYYPGGVLPLGYKAIPAPDNARRKLIVIDELERPLARLIFDLALFGTDKTGPLGISAIRDHLHKNGHRTRKGSLFSINTIHSTLTNSIYAGTKSYNVDPLVKEWEPGPAERVHITVPAIVGHDEFARLQNMLRAKDPRSGTAKTMSSPLLLAGLARCKCGGAMCLGTGTSARGPVYRYYHCNTSKRKGALACAGTRISEELLDEMLLKEVLSQVLRVERLTEILGRIQEQLAQENLEGSRRLSDLQRETEISRREYENLIAIASHSADFGSDPIILEKLRSAQGHHQRNVRALEGLLVQDGQIIELTDEHIQYFSELVSKRLRAPDKMLAKAYLNAIVLKVEVDGEKVVIVGSVPDLKKRVEEFTTKMFDETAETKVRGYVAEWCPMPAHLKSMNTMGLVSVWTLGDATRSLCFFEKCPDLEDVNSSE